MPDPERTALYRFYDVAGVLLYVGVSKDLQARCHQHSISQGWWHLVRRQDIQWYPDRESAERAETNAIITEGPLYNIDQVPNAKLDQGKYDDTEDRRRIKRLLRRDAKGQYFYIGRTVHLGALAERYDVSSTTLWSVMRELSERSFELRRQRATVRSKPNF